MYDNIKLLDCTLRDGGYINNWNFGKYNIKEIIRELVKARIDIIEVGFLRKAEDYTLSADVTKWEDIRKIEEYLPEDKGETLFSAMCIHNFYDINLLPDREDSCIDLLRITFHDYDYQEGIAFCRRAVEKGYKVSCNPINIMGYSDSELLKLLDLVNGIHPYAFSIVDTFGSMKQKDLDRLVGLIENNLNHNINLGLHLHENLSQSFSLAQNFINKQLHKKIIIDGSLMGMGRTPGNLSLELIADYLNDNYDKNYNIDCMLDTIEDHIAILKGTNHWGYTPAYFLSAKYNLHRNYAEHYLNKGNLTHKDINHILSRIGEDKKTVFDNVYADAIYKNYMENRIDDVKSRKNLIAALEGKQVLILAPGKTLKTHYDSIMNVIMRENPVIICVNFIEESITPDFVFFSNNKRYEKYGSICKCPILATSNIITETSYYFDYNSLAETFSQGSNSLVMLLHLLADVGIKEVMLAGADGYTKDGNDYFDSSIHSFTRHDHNFNYYVASAIHKQAVKVKYITPSFYNIEY